MWVRAAHRQLTVPIAATVLARQAPHSRESSSALLRTAA